MAKEFYYRHRAQKSIVGPITVVELRSEALNGSVTPSTLIKVGDGDWIPASRLKGLFDENGRPIPHSAKHADDNSIPVKDDDSFAEMVMDSIDQIEEPKLISCPDCEKEISNRAKTCPNCGCQIKSLPPISRRSNTPRHDTHSDNNANAKRYNALKIYGAICSIAGVIFLVVSVIILILAIANYDKLGSQAWTLIVGSFVIAAMSLGPFAISSGITAFIDLVNSSDQTKINSTRTNQLLERIAEAMEREDDT